MNPVTMVKHIFNLFQKITCENCNTEGYCVCSLDSTYLNILNENECLICYHFGNTHCRYCY